MEKSTCRFRPWSVGDVIRFWNAKPGVNLPACGFRIASVVEHRGMNANSDILQVGLSDLTVPTAPDARAVAEYFERGFGLFADVYGE